MSIPIEFEVTGAFIVGLLLSTFVAYRSYVRNSTIQRFFWGNSSIRPSLTASLMLSTSFGLNGLMYQVLLAYQIGYWALLVQTVWCVGFLLLAWRIHRVSPLSISGTLHGVISQYYGSRAGRIAAWLSAISFSLLVGWEIVIGVRLFTTLLNGNLATAIVWSGLILLGAMWYTMTGGIRGDNLTNSIGNAFKAAVLFVGMLLLILHSGITLRAGEISPSVIATTVTWSGFATNLFFSLFWQCADMAIWQTVAATSGSETGRWRALTINAVAAWIFPGFIGTIIGIALIPHSGLTGDTVLPTFISELSAIPFITPLILTAFVMAVLGTVDLYVLSAGQAISWDILHPTYVPALLKAGTERDATQADTMIINSARKVITAFGLGGVVALMYFVFGLGRDVFEAVYFVVVLLMALAPLMLVILFGPKQKLKYKGGAIALFLGFLAGSTTSVLGLLGVGTSLASGMGWNSTLDTDLYNLAPIVGFVVAALTLALASLLAAFVSHWRTTPISELGE